MAYRLVKAGWTTLGEVDRLSLEYIEEANIVLDAYEDAELRARAKAKEQH